MVRHTKKRTQKHRRKTRGGYYSASGAIAPGAMGWKAESEMGPYSAEQINSGMQYGRGRRRRNKKSKRTRRMKGGGGTKFGAVAASFEGTGSRGMADYGGTNTKFPPFGGSTHGAFNNKGAQPGSGFGSFNILPQ